MCGLKWNIKGHLCIGILFLLLGFDHTKAQQLPVFSDEIILYRGERFMPFIDGPVEEYSEAAQGLSRQQARLERIFLKSLDSITEILKKCPDLDTPQGFKLVIRKNSSPPFEFHENKSFSAKIQFELFATLVCNEKPCFDRKTDATITLYINNPEKLVSTHVMDDIWLQPKIVSDFFGYPVYRFNSINKEITVVREGTVPVYMTVTREDFIMSLIGHFNEMIVENQRKAELPQSKELLSLTGDDDNLRRFEFEEAYNKLHRFDPLLARKLKENFDGSEKILAEAKTDSLALITREQYIKMQMGVWREGIRKLRAELNAMSPSERRSQAHWSESEAMNTSGLTPPGHPGSNPVARLNPAVLDNSMPDTDIQIIIIEWGIDPAPFANFKQGRNLQYHKLYRFSQCEDSWRQVFRLVEREEQ